MQRGVWAVILFMTAMKLVCAYVMRTMGARGPVEALRGGGGVMYGRRRGQRGFTSTTTLFKKKQEDRIENGPLPFKMTDIVELCKRRGFVFQSSEIYASLPGFFDYGPLGVELKNNIKKLWWRDMVQRRPDVVGLDASIISSNRVWEASGHVAGFRYSCSAVPCSAEQPALSIGPATHLYGPSF
jgi:hypothetical protein